MNFNNYFIDSLSYASYVELLGDNLPLHNLHYRNFELKPEDKEKISALKPYHILTITEPWCGDSLALLPIVKKISECNANWKLKIVLRDQNLSLIDRFLTNGGRAIPIFLFLDEKGEFILKWGPRPLNAQNIFDQFREKIKNGEVEKSKVILKIRKYYAKDKGKETSAELLNKIFTHLT